MQDSLSIFLKCKVQDKISTKYAIGSTFERKDLLISSNK